MHLKRFRYIGALLGALFCAGAHAAEPELRYNREVRPILSDNCFACHGFDAASRKSKLRLDMAEDGEGYRGAYSVLTPGNPDEGEFMARVLSHDPDDIMPPPESEKRLKPEQIETLRRWIAEGAKFEPHWAYITPVRPPLPATATDAWVSNPIDAFVLNRMRLGGLEPSEVADPVTLARRLHFDLTGLPPAPETVAAFAADPTPEAYGRMVEQLLSSPQYGERMAVDWLDQVRYADTNGFHSDEKRSVWPYRDYVIRAFNENKPFDQFTREQLGGDLMPGATVEQRVAAAYNRLNQLTAEGGAQPKEYIAIYAADRVRTVSSVWLGSTMACAQCHDHKYDPLSIKDFYKMSAFFADIKEQAVYGGRSRWEPVLELPTPEQQQELDRLNRRIALLEKRLANPTPRMERDFEAWLQEQGARLGRIAARQWRYVKPQTVSADNGTAFTLLEDDSVLSQGPLPTDEVYRVTLRPGAANLTGIRLEVLRDASFPRAVSRGNGNFVLSGVELWLLRGDAPPERVTLAKAEATLEQETWPVAATLDEDPKTGWAVNGHVQEDPQAAAFKLATPLTLSDEDRLELVLRHETGLAGHAIGRFRLALSEARNPRAKLPGNLSPDLLYPLTHLDAARDDRVTAGLRKRFLEDYPELDDERALLAESRAALEEAKAAIPYTLATESIEPRVTRVLPRGNWMDESGEVVEPGTPEALPPLSVEGRRANRLDFADWIVSPENPLTARVFVNRLWKNYFGRGIAEVLDDLGSQGPPPSHPDLLDWLAVEFRESGWDVKHMVRLMVTSSAYRQSSRASEETLRQDPLNRLHARQTRYRLEAELVRDNALAVAGLLSGEVGGPSFYPYQPDGYYDNCNAFGGDLSYPTSQEEEQYRRGLYTFWKRSFLHPMLLAFDAPSREECTADRPASNSPLQALVLLNDPTFVEAARVFAQRILEQGGQSLDARLDYAFERALSRRPEPEERELLAGLLESQRAHYASAPDAAVDFVTVGQAPLPAGIPAPELAAWTAVARAILNLHETITRL
ncbi:MAG: hypothetical protein RLZZ303_472 [Candidatus Hydrogenedentota bacterium]